MAIVPGKRLVPDQIPTVIVADGMGEDYEAQIARLDSLFRFRSSIDTIPGYLEAWR